MSSSSCESDDAVSSIPSSPISNSSEGPTSPTSSPEKCVFKKYGRVYRQVSSLNSRGSLANVPETKADTTDNFRVVVEEVSSDSSSESDISTSTSTNDCSSSSSGRTSVSSVHSDSSECSNLPESESECDTEVQELFSGSNRTTDEAIVALMDLYIKRRWKLTTLKEVLKFCKTFFPSNLPTTDYKLFTYVESYAPDNYNEVCHYYCGDCLTLKEGRKEKCKECDSTSCGVFFEFPVSTQIKHLFEQRDIASLIDSYRNQICCNDGNILDIISGEAFRKLKTKVTGKYDITLLFNSDGVSPVNSSDAHLYPILATICELPPKIRATYMIVLGIWYDIRFAPVMNDFFSPLVDALNKVNEEGILWTHPRTKQEIKSVVIAPVMSADALARADILVMQHHNSKYGCNNCEQKTKRFKPEGGGKKIRRYLYQEKPARLRDHSRMNEQGHKAAEGIPVKGIVGNAVVSRMPYFNRGASAPPEYMHCVLLGVVKQFIKLWFHTDGDWNIKSKMDDINEFITEYVKVTDHFVRIPKSVNNLPLWKASDFRVWLLFISLPALYGHLKEKYFQHYMLLVSAIYVLLQQKLTPNDLIMTETKLRIFVRDIGKLYHLKDYTYNVHNLLHLVEHVRKWGPLWAFSAFPFENFNHVLGDLAPGPKHKGKQIVNKIRLANGLEILRNKTSQRQVKSAIKDVIALGNPVVIDRNLSTTVDLPPDTKLYFRANVKGEVFTTQHYDKKVKRANSYIKFETITQSIGYGQIMYFYEDNLQVNCLIKIFKVEHRDIFTHIEGKFSVLHLVPISDSDLIISIIAKAIVTKLSKVGNFLCIRPNSIEENL